MQMGHEAMLSCERDCRSHSIAAQPVTWAAFLHIQVIRETNIAAAPYHLNKDVYVPEHSTLHGEHGALL